MNYLYVMPFWKNIFLHYVMDFWVKYHIFVFFSHLGAALQLISCVRCFKNGQLQSILYVFISVEPGLDTRSEKQ